MNFRARRTLAAGTTLIIAAALASACSSSKPQPQKAPAGAHIAATVGPAVQLVSNVHPAPPSATRSATLSLAVREQTFALNLLRHAGSSANITLSPASLAIALTMLNLGAAGATQRQITDVLAMSDTTAEAQASQWAALSEDWRTASTANKIALQSANSLWLQNGFPPETDLSRRSVPILQFRHVAGRLPWPSHSGRPGNRQVGNQTNQRPHHVALQSLRISTDPPP